MTDRFADSRMVVGVELLVVALKISQDVFVERI